MDALAASGPKVTIPVMLVQATYKACERIKTIALQILTRAVDWVKKTLACNIAPLILPSLLPKRFPVSQEAVDTILAELNSSQSKAMAATYTSPDAAKISVLTLLSSKNPSKTTVIYLPSRSGSWQDSIQYLRRLHLDANVHIYAPNFRSKDAATLENDIYQFSKWLIQNGIPSDKLIFFGSDIGAFIATCVAGKLADEDITVDVISDAGAKSMHSYVQHNFPLCSNAVATFVSSIGWEFDVEEALKKLKGRFISLSSPHDPVVPPSISVNTLTENTTLQCTVLNIAKDENIFAQEQPQRAEDPNCCIHTRPYTEQEHAALVQVIRAGRR